MSKPALSKILKCPECGWVVGHNIACKYELGQEILKLREELERLKSKLSQFLGAA